MTDWNNLQAEKRIAAWRQFRLSQQNLPLDEVVKNTVDFFSDIPIGSRTIDYYTPGEWPDPWEILHNQQYCENTVTLLMYYTIALVAKPEKLNIWLIDDTESRFIVPVLNESVILNYFPRELINLKEHSRIAVVEKFTKEQIKEIY